MSYPSSNVEKFVYDFVLQSETDAIDDDFNGSLSLIISSKMSISYNLCVNNEFALINYIIDINNE
jgi:hypothetical protein